MTRARLVSLIALAGDVRTPIEEARTAALLACREIVRSGWRVVERAAAVSSGWPTFKKSLDRNQACCRCKRRIAIGRWVVTYSTGDAHCRPCSLEEPRSGWRDA
jgi:hypothetical protein